MKTLLSIIKSKVKKQELTPKQQRWIDINIREKLKAAVVSCIIICILWWGIDFFKIAAQDYRPHHKTQFFSSSLYNSINRALDALATKYKKSTGQYNFYSTLK